jgi:hypothetical protein
MKLEDALEELESAVHDAAVASTHMKLKSKGLEGELTRAIVKEKRTLDALKELRVELKDAMLSGGQVG